ncbi:MAG: histidinol dehydrogenase [Anaerolineaceae bacterium]|nr:histidinol dehydrogenase [Anaerolineaceae bacterium]MDE0329665.1 histidinol dehydrogenase [Anaerolineaceae bacterium]
MITYRELAQLSNDERRLLMRRAETDIRSLLPVVQEVVDQVRACGDEALVSFARRWDCAEFDASLLRASDEDFVAAREAVSDEVIAAIEAAHDNIRKFHRKQVPEEMWFSELQPGVMAGEMVTPIASVGLYVPRGKGAFPSVMLMLATPARVAAVPRVVVVTPPAPDGRADPGTLVAAQICGIDEVFVVGGSQAIAALAFGTEMVPRVDKVVGPGNQYVSAAKRLLYGDIDVGLPAGPSEAVILCDEGADPRLAALDLLVEAEHGPDSAALLVTHSRSVADGVLEVLPGLIDELPAWRREFVARVLSGYGGILLTQSLDDSIAFVNDYAPEHLELLTDEPFVTLNRIQNAGEILLGPLTPIPLANYCLGLNAILPTGGFARSFSSVSVHDFLKRSGVAYLSREGYERLQGVAITLADYEDFPAHALALRRRNEIFSHE